MATTPNYGWVMPDPTDFVTNLPADFEIFGDAVDATVDGIETTANAAQPNVITTEGDLVIGDASGDPIRLPIGAANTILQSDGDTATWVAAPSGGWAVIASGNLSGTTVNLTSIPQTYKNLRLIVRGITAAADDFVRLRINGVTANYFGQILQNANGAVSQNSGAGASFWQETIDLDNTSGQSARSIWVLDLPDYTDTTTYKQAELLASYNNSSAQFKLVNVTSRQVATSAVTSVQIICDLTMTGGTYQLLGLG